MHRLLVCLVTVAVGGLLLPATAGAQGGTLSGLVEDSTGGILPGVTIEADSPVNIEGTLTAFSDGSGRFTIINLRPGTYTVTFTLPGFNTFVREGIIMSGDAAVQVNAEMAVGSLEETVTVSGESPVVDVQQVRRQFVATRAMMDVLPAARTMEARALLIPGVRNAGMGEGLYWTTVHGSTSRDSQTMNDGMRANSTVDDGQFRMGWEMSDAATSELTFEAGGAPAEVQVGGVIQNAIPKEGGNTFSGTWFTYYGSGAMAGDNASPELRAQLGEVNKLAFDIDTNPAFGGKLIEDKLWFFTAYRTSERKTFAAGTFFADPETGLCRPVAVDCGFEPTSEEYFGNGAEPGTQAFNRTWGMTGVMRLTNQVTDRHKWRLGFERLNRQHPMQNIDLTRPPESGDWIRQPTGYHSQARWTSSISNRLLVEAGFSVQYNKWRREQFEWNQDQSSTYDVGTGTWGGGFWITGWQPEKSRHLKASMSYVTGSHNFKVGMEHRWGNLGLDQPMANDVRTYYYYNGAPIGVQVLGTPVISGGTFDGGYEAKINYDTGLFAQDAWTLGNWTLNLGTRADFFKSGVPVQHAPAGTWVPERDFPAYPGPHWNTIVGRIGAAYDMFGDGRTALKFTLHQYVSSESTRLALLRNPLSSEYSWSAAQEFRSWNDLDGNGSVEAADGRIAYEEVGPSPNVNFGTANDLKSLDLDGREGNYEFNVSLQHELLNGISTSIGWYRRDYFKMWWTDNILQSHSDYTPFNIVGPVDSRLGGNSGQTLTLFNLNPDVFGQSSTSIRTGENRDRIYNGVEWTLDGRLSNGAFFGGSITHEKTQQNECDVDNRNDTIWCDSPRAWQTMYKAHGAWPLPGGVILSGFVQGYPGPELNANYNVSALPDGTALTGGARISVDLLPPEVLFLPFARKTDIRVMRRFNIGNTQIAPVLDVFNIFNTNTTTRVNTTYGSNWQDIVAIMQARYMRIGLELEW